jgi:pimeloyl-ACP methyl ester carboxylesterase
VPAAARFASRVVAWDLPGHGESNGICTLGVHEIVDLLALIDQLPPGDVVLWGWSLGAGLSLAAANQHRDHRITAIICESAYRFVHTPPSNVLAARELPWRINLPVSLWTLGTIFGAGPRWRGFDRKQIAAKLAGHIPVLVIHGAMDIVCPLEDSQSICDAAKGELVVIDTAGHNDLWSNAAHAAECESRIAAFMRAAPIAAASHTQQ